MTVDDKKTLSGKFWICLELYAGGDNKVRDHDPVTNKYRGSHYVHRDCNINLKLTKKNPVIFHNLRGYDNHLITQEIDKSDIKIYVMPNRLETYMAITDNGNWVFTNFMDLWILV